MGSLLLDEESEPTTYSLGIPLIKVQKYFVIFLNHIFSYKEHGNPDTWRLMGWKDNTSTIFLLNAFSSLVLYCYPAPDLFKGMFFTLVFDWGEGGVKKTIEK